MKLNDRHRPTGNTKHMVNGSQAATPQSLQIVQYEDDSGFYLLYLNERGDEITDTWHETLDDAFGQATFEFTLAPADWTKCLN